MADLFGLGMIVEDFRQDGSEVCVSEMLKRLATTPESWSAHPLNTFPGMPSGSAAFCVFTVLSIRITSYCVQPGAG